LVDASQTYDISYRGLFPFLIISNDIINSLVILVGDSGVGKTNIMSRWTKDTYSSETQSTITIECKSRSYSVDGKIVCVQIWDTGIVITVYYLI
jgi:GTPase SAR1 family protein